MRLKLLITSCMLLFSLLSPADLQAAEIKYKVSDIPKPLLKDAKAVVRLEETGVEIASNDKLVQTVRYAITILNKNGESNSYFRHSYNKSMKISDIKAHLYNENGVEFKKKGGFEIRDYAMISEGTTFADLRIKFTDPEQTDYPYTVEYTYVVTFSDVISYPGWNPIRDYNVSVEKSKYTLILSKQANCRYYENNIPAKAAVQIQSENTAYTWELSNSAALEEEYFSPALEDITPSVLIAPSHVKVEGYEGNFETWAGLGLWINQLNQDRNNLNSETRARIRKLTEGMTDDRAKVKKLYEYMQNKTRYVSIQVGIGGYQPFDAETVDRLSYGDCKALSNYMKSILEVAGISSRYTLVKAGAENPTIYTDFPSSQFNHAIVCVPMPTDTIWLECTDQNNPFNYLGKFTADRDVLVIDAAGGKLVHTPVLKAETNLESRKINVTLDPSGGGFADAKNTFRGATYDSYVPILMSDQADRKKMVTRRIHIPNFELDNFSIQETKTEKPFVTERLNLTITSYCTKVGEKLMLCPNLMNKLEESPFTSATRKSPISIKWPVNEIDTVNYNLPQGYTLEKIPPKISIQSDFGLYTARIIKSGSSLQYIRTFEVFKAEYPLERYDDMVLFFEKIVTADENKVMLTRTL